jgi:hypothetical protein
MIIIFIHKQINEEFKYRLTIIIGHPDNLELILLICTGYEGILFQHNSMLAIWWLIIFDATRSLLPYNPVKMQNP